MTTFGVLVVSAIERYPDRVLFRHALGSKVSYAEAAKRIAATLKRFRDLGVKRGDHVAAYLEDTIPSAVFISACALHGVVCAPVSPLFSVNYLKKIAERLNTKYVLAALDHAKVVAAELGTRPLCYVSSPNSEVECIEEDPDISLDASMALLREGISASSESDPLVILATAGPTGEPKLVVRNHAGFLSYANALTIELSVGRELGVCGMLAAAPLTHSLGLDTYALCLSLGARLDVPSRIDTNIALNEVRGMDPEIVPVPPRVLRSFYRQHLRQIADEPNRRLFGSHAKWLLTSGSTSDLELLRYVASEGVGVLESYGTNETGLVAVTPQGGWREGFVGRVLDSVKVERASDGELLVNAPTKMIGYFGDEAQSRESYAKDGYFRTGDIGDLSPDLYIRLNGKKRDVFTTPEGSDIYPERIENLIEEIQGVRQAILVGDNRPYLCAFIVTNERAWMGVDPDGFLDEKRFASAYQKMGEKLAQINTQMERVERIACFALFNRPFKPEVYSVDGAGVRKRERKLFLSSYSARIERLYSQLLPFKNNGMLVGPAERRFRPRGAE